MHLCMCERVCLSHPRNLISCSPHNVRSTQDTHLVREKPWLRIVSKLVIDIQIIITSAGFGPRCVCSKARAKGRKKKTTTTTTKEQNRMENRCWNCQWVVSGVIGVKDKLKPLLTFFKNTFIYSSVLE